MESVTFEQVMKNKGNTFKTKAFEFSAYLGSDAKIKTEKKIYQKISYGKELWKDALMPKVHSTVLERK